MSIYLGYTDLPEFNASKVALAYSRLSLCNKVLKAGSGNDYSAVLVRLYQEVKVPTSEFEEGLTYLNPRTNFVHSTKDNISLHGSTFIESINKMAAWR